MELSGASNSASWFPVVALARFEAREYVEKGSAVAAALAPLYEPQESCRAPEPVAFDDGARGAERARRGSEVPSAESHRASSNSTATSTGCSSRARSRTWASETERTSRELGESDQSKARQCEVDFRYNSGYTLRMKTAISIPDPLFDAAEEVADRLGMNRSQLYAKALSEYVAKHRDDDVTEALNRVYAKYSSTLDPVLAAMQFASLPQEDW